MQPVERNKVENPDDKYVRNKTRIITNIICDKGAISFPKIKKQCNQVEYEKGMCAALAERSAVL